MSEANRFEYVIILASVKQFAGLFHHASDFTDLVTATNRNSVEIRRNRHDARFDHTMAPGYAIDSVFVWHSAVAADVNRDGHIDVAVLFGTDGALPSDGGSATPMPGNRPRRFPRHW